MAKSGAGHVFDANGAKRIINAVRRIEQMPVNQPRRARRQPVIGGLQLQFEYGAPPYIDTEHAGTDDAWAYPVIEIAGTPDPIILDARFVDWYDPSSNSQEGAGIDNSFLLWTLEKFEDAIDIPWIGGTAISRTSRHVIYVKLDEEVVDSGLFDAHITDGTGAYDGIAVKMRVASELPIITPMAEDSVCMVSYSGSYDGTPGVDTEPTDVLPIFNFILGVC